jgi:hypothetical protein
MGRFLPDLMVGTVVTIVVVTLVTALSCSWVGDVGQ